MEIYQASILDQQVEEHTGLPRRPVERNADAHRGDPDDGRYADFGMRVLGPRTSDKPRKEKPKHVSFSEIPEKPPDEPEASRMEISVGYRGRRHTTYISPASIDEEAINAIATSQLDYPLATTDHTGIPTPGQQFRCHRDL
jgi:hypothetical protein